MDASQSLRDVGYAVFPALYSRAFVDQARQEVARLYKKAGSPALSQRGKSEIAAVHGELSGSGLLFARLLAQAPTLVEGYFHPQIVDVYRDVLDSSARLDATGACLADEHRIPVVPWHNHVGGVDDHLKRPIDLETLKPDRIRRLITLIYLDGVSEERGPLLIHPRKLSDPLDCPSDAPHHADLAGNTVISGPPGTAVLLEERTWHAALAPKYVGHRCFLAAVVAAHWAPPADNREPMISVPEGAFAGGVFDRNP